MPRGLLEFCLCGNQFSEHTKEICIESLPETLELLNLAQIHGDSLKRIRFVTPLPRCKLMIKFGRDSIPLRLRIYAPLHVDVDFVDRDGKEVQVETRVDIGTAGKRIDII